MNYVINTGQNFQLTVSESALECLIKEYSELFDNLLNFESLPKLVIRIDGINEGKEIILSYSLEEWNVLVYLVTKGNDLIQMAIKLFDKLLNFFERNLSKE